MQTAQVNLGKHSKPPCIYPDFPVRDSTILHVGYVFCQTNATPLICHPELLLNIYLSFSYRCATSIVPSRSINVHNDWIKWIHFEKNRSNIKHWWFTQIRSSTPVELVLQFMHSRNNQMESCLFKNSIWAHWLKPIDFNRIEKTSRQLSVIMR